MSSRNPISIIIWRAAYALEEARQRYAGKGQLLRQSGACIALAVLRLRPKRRV